MPGLIPDNLLEDILNRVDIVELISGFIPLKRSGRNFKACCPFHQEKTASFMVSPDRQIYHCFGCGESGNAFKFLMRYERLEFPEAVEFLASKAGVELPKFERQNDAAAGLTTQLYRVNELAADFYEGILNSSEGIRAKNYLLKRGILHETIKNFKLGFAPERWDGLINHLRQKGINLSLIEKAGLILAKDSGGYYDRFRNRVIFPILDIKSRPVGFGARVLDDSLPKYVNSPETPVYTKGKNLYGLNFAKDSIRDGDCAVIVEGYLDFILPFQSGIKNIVASQGTALTTEQARLLRRYTHDVVVLFDGDSAGELAALRSLDIFIEEEMNVRVAGLPKGVDPDSYVRAHGAQEFKAKIEKAQSLFDYKLAVLKGRFDCRDVQGKVKICASMLETINKIKNAVLRSEYIKKLSQELDVDEDALLQEVSKLNPERAPSGPTLNAVKKISNISPVEKLLIKLMLEESELIRRIREHLDPQDFKDEHASRIVSLMFDLADQGKEVGPHILMNHFAQDDVSRLVCESVFMPESPSEEHKERVIADCIKRIKEERMRLKKQVLHDQIKVAQSLGDEEKLNRLIEEFHGLLKKEVKA